MTHIAGWDELYEGVPVYLHIYLLPWILVPILSFLLTLSSLLFISKSSRIPSAVKYILGNLVFNTAAYFAFSLILPAINGQPTHSTEHYASHQQIYFLPIPILGLLVTFLKIILSHYYNIPLPTCFSLPRVEYGALVCSDLQAHYILGTNGKLERVLQYEEDEEEEVNKQNEVLVMSEVASDTFERVASQEEKMVEVVLDQPEEEHQEAEIQAV